MMELEYSPRHSPTASPHLLSPTHAHHSALEGFTVTQIRRSLSRSPSKPQRYSLFTTKSPSSTPTAPRSPSNLSQTHNAKSMPATEPVFRQKYPVKRANSGRLHSRRTSPTSPMRRALSDNNSQANVGARAMRKSSLEGAGQENGEHQHTSALDRPKLSPPAIRDDPIKIDFLKPDKYLQPALKEHTSPMKSSPLKRSDGVMNLEAATFGSPRNKRRSLHGASFGHDFNVFDQCPDFARDDKAESLDAKEKDTATPILNSPQRRPFGPRKSTVHQRGTPARSRLFQDAPSDPALLSPSLTRARSRISLDSALPLRTFDVDSPFRRSSANEPPILFAPNPQKPYQSAPKPHPLSHALTPSSSASSVLEDDQRPRLPPHNAIFPQPNTTRDQQPLFSFSKSLPVGVNPVPKDQHEHSSQDSYATPEAYKMAKPHPQAFMSTGLISKRNRNVEIGLADFGVSMMPDTPSKKASHVQITSPARPPSALGHVPRPMHEFGSPSTPFNGRVSKIGSDTFGSGMGIFGTQVGAPQLTRRGSFISIDGDDNAKSPSDRLETAAIAEDIPPTPTKSNYTIGPRPQSKGGKSNSLRSSLFGRRTSLGPDTFASPDNGDDDDAESVDMINNQEESGEQKSPHTPQDHEHSFAPPDPSNLSISVDFRTSTSLQSSNSFPPATPTGPRDSFGISSKNHHSMGSSSYFSNDVDTSLTARFGQIVTTGIGEFSEVYRVERPLQQAQFQSQAQRSTSAGNVWAVKKSRRPYTGHKDRQRKMREVHILKALRGHEHIVEFTAEWESKNHLYIQTEFCENGNLKDFLTSTGFKGRLDDFRIWKILLELAQGVKAIHDAGYIHLDLKPANVFIDWEGVLKIGDFGMASSWPAPAGLDGEGDREYIGPEVLSGRFDKPADIFALGMVLLEIAGNIVLPDNGMSWQRLRAGDMSDLPSLTWSSDSTLLRNDSGDPIESLHGTSNESLCVSVQNAEDDLSFLKAGAVSAGRAQDLVHPPNFMVDPADPEALDAVVQWMISPLPDRRPTVEQLLAAGGVLWVDRRRRAGATVYEGNWGPADDVLNHETDVEMLDI